MGLEDKTWEPIRRLSGGQQRRVATARTLAQRPNLILADEFLSELDEETMLNVIQAVVEYSREEAAAIVLIEHDIGRARKIADRLVVMDDGRLNPFLSETKTLEVKDVTRKIRINPALFAVFCFFTSVYLALGAVDDWGRLSTGFGNLKTFFVESLWPPDWSIFEPRLYPECNAPLGLSITCSTAWIGMSETLKIAFISTFWNDNIPAPLSGCEKS